MERLSIEANGFVFDALAAGPADGQLVLLLHGFPQTGVAWRHQLGALAGAGYRAVAPDLRGCSPGARPADVGAYHLDHLARDALALADVLLGDDRARFHCVGHDWGGLVAWRLGGSHGSRLLSLSVIATPHPRAYAESLRRLRGWQQWPRASYVPVFRLPIAERMFTAGHQLGLRLLLRVAGLPPAQAAPHLAAYRTPEDLRGPLSWYRAANRGVLQSFRDVDVPTLYCFPGRDPAVARAAVEGSARHVTGPYRFEELRGANHWVLELQPDRINGLLLEHLGGRTAPVRR